MQLNQLYQIFSKNKFKKKETKNSDKQLKKQLKEEYGKKCIIFNKNHLN